MNFQDVLKTPNAQDVYFNGDHDAWFHYITHNHGLVWVDDFVNLVNGMIYDDSTKHQANIRKIIGLLNYQTLEYNHHNGDVTCEFSISEEYVPIMDLLCRYFKPINAKWVWYECHDCKRQHPDKPIHVEIG
jgi:hypothetical protein